jgi:hypothetical protein
MLRCCCCAVAVVVAVAVAAAEIPSPGFAAAVAGHDGAGGGYSVKDVWRPKEDVAPHRPPEFPTPDITLVPLEYRWLNPGERAKSLCEIHHPFCRQYFHSQVFCLHTPQHNNTFDNFHGAAPPPPTFCTTRPSRPTLASGIR